MLVKWNGLIGVHETPSKMQGIVESVLVLGVLSYLQSSPTLCGRASARWDAVLMAFVSAVT